MTTFFWPVTYVICILVLYKITCITDLFNYTMIKYRIESRGK